MRRRTLYHIVFPILVLGLLLISGLAWHEALVWTSTLVAIYIFLNNLTVKINFLDVTAVAACASYLMMPMLVYNVFGEHNKLAALWQTYMTIDKSQYFSLALPGTIGLLLGLWAPPMMTTAMKDEDLINRVKIYLKRKTVLGFVMICIGLMAMPLVLVAPESLRALTYFISQLTYVGVLYLLHSNIRLKAFGIIFIFMLMIAQTVITGMYGELVYWSVMGFILMMIGKKWFTLPYKILLLIFGVVILFMIQSIKHEYRDVVWKGAVRGNDSALFFRLVADRIQHPSHIFDPERIYKVVVRANQGYLVGRAMEYVPKHEPFAKGETIAKSFLAGIVPRFLWRDKPKVGGQENICRFLGDCGKYNYSYNIGQLGEAYVNFGVVGAWMYMFFYGYLLKSLFHFVRYLSVKRPSLILWAPVLFYPAMVVETDLLTFFNTFIKGAIFCAFIYFIFRVVLKYRI